MKKENIVAYMIIQDGEPVYMTDDGKFWKGGTDVFVPILKDKEDAKKIRKALQKNWKNKEFKPKWFKVVPVKLIKYTRFRK
jgi:hypothetical protein